MALGTMAQFKSKNVKILPVGLNYFHRERFRSSVIVEFGKVLEVPTEWAEEFKINRRLTIEKLLNEIELRMRAVTLQAESYNDFRSMLLFRNMYIPKDVVLSPSQFSELCKRFSKGYKKMNEIPECDEFKKKTIKYMEEIDEIAVRDREVRDTNFEQEKMKRKFLKATGKFLLVLLFLTPGILILMPFIWYIMQKAEKERKAVSIIIIFRRKKKTPTKLRL